MNIERLPIPDIERTVTAEFQARFKHHSKVHDRFKAIRRARSDAGMKIPGYVLGYFDDERLTFRVATEFGDCGYLPYSEEDHQ